MFCVYLTTYYGNKLPMFYIGSSKISKVRNGYRGSVSSRLYKSAWQQELKQNPKLFKTKIISYHVSDKDARKKEAWLQEKLNVVRSPMYINMSVAKINGFFGSPNTAHNKNTRAWTDGQQITYAVDSPGDGWVLGCSDISNHNKSIADRKSGSAHHNYGRSRSATTNKKFVDAVSKPYKVTTPSGDCYIIRGLKKYCCNNNINVSGAHRVLAGTQDMYKGYKFEKIDI